MPSIPRSDGSSVSQFSKRGSGNRLDKGFATERDHKVDVANEAGIDGLRRLVADVDSDFGQ
jgi:hypothetical protein